MRATLFTFIREKKVVVRFAMDQMRTRPWSTKGAIEINSKIKMMPIITIASIRTRKLMLIFAFKSYAGLRLIGCPAADAVCCRVDATAAVSENEEDQKANSIAVYFWSDDFYMANTFDSVRAKPNTNLFTKGQVLKVTPTPRLRRYTYYILGCLSSFSLSLIVRTDGDSVVGSDRWGHNMFSCGRSQNKIFNLEAEKEAEHHSLGQ